MRKPIYFLFSTLISLTSASNIYASSSNSTKYEIPPASTPVKTDADIGLLQKIERANQKLAENSSKGLVFISVSKTMKMPQYIDPFEYFFGRQAPMGPPQQQERPRLQEGFGSGFFFDLKKGYIMTNNHVVENAEKISLKLANGKKYDGKIIGHDKDTDVAVVQVADSNFSRDNLSELVLDDSDKVAIGSSVIAIGAPFLLEASVTSGIVSAVGRGSLSLTKMGNFTQTDAAINPGNSGGPLINTEGKVIGVNSAIYSQSGAYAGIGFAIPSNIARRIATALINNERFYKGYVGISYEFLNEERAMSLDLPKSIKRGIIIADVMPGGPAQKAKLEPWDVIVAVDGKEFDPENLISVIGLKEPGTKLNFTVYRQGKKLNNDIEVIVGTTPNVKEMTGTKEKAQKSKSQDSSVSRFGFTLEPANDRLRSQCELSSKSGLVITYVEPVSSAWRQGFRECDVITGVNGKRVNTVEAFEASTKERSHNLLQIDRKGRSLFAQLSNEKSEKK